MYKICVVVPNWNGSATLSACLDSLISQTYPVEIVVVENGSTDASRQLLHDKYPQVTVLQQDTNLGFAGGVNVGILHAINEDYDLVALFNNDAVADVNWAKNLQKSFSDQSVGIAACTLANSDGTHLDSTGEYFSVWGLPFPRGRGEAASGQFDDQTEIFGASGGASLYRVSMLKEIGLFDEDFFAYYEDVDISFRAQLAGWKIRYVPEAIAYHDAGTTSRKIKGFTTYQTMKNQPLVIFKNVPTSMLWRVTWRFMIAHTLFFARAVSRGQGWIALKGDAEGTRLLFKKTGERRRIQNSRTVSDEYIWSIMTHDLPPNAHALRKMRATWWKLTGKNRG